MKAIIIYKGKYGATKQYATWLGQETGIPARDADIINGDQLDDYDTLLIGSSVYVGRLKIRKWLKRNFLHLINKKILFFQVAAAPPEEKDKRNGYNIASMPKEIFENCDFYFLPGRMIMKKLFWEDRILLRMGAKLAKDPRDKQAMLTDYDHVTKEQIAPLVEAVRKFYIPARSERIPEIKKAG